MNSKIENDIHFNILKTIVQSVNDIFSHINNKSELSSTVSDSILTIFEFIDKIVDTLPNIINNEGDKVHIRNEMKNSIDEIILKWNQSNITIEELYETWEEFVYWWYEYFHSYYGLEKLKKGLYINLN